MGDLSAKPRVMYWAPTRRRHYAKLSQAARAEAGAMMRAKHGGTGDEWWGNDMRLRLVQYRMARRIEARFRRGGATP